MKWTEIIAGLVIGVVMGTSVRAEEPKPDVERLVKTFGGVNVEYLGWRFDSTTFKTCEGGIELIGEGRIIKRPSDRCPGGTPPLGKGIEGKGVATFTASGWFVDVKEARRHVRFFISPNDSDLFVMARRFRGKTRKVSYAGFVWNPDDNSSGDPPMVGRLERIALVGTPQDWRER